jgi:hypothetical protein
MHGLPSPPGFVHAGSPLHARSVREDRARLPRDGECHRARAGRTWHRAVPHPVAVLVAPVAIAHDRADWLRAPTGALQGRLGLDGTPP